MVPHAIKAADKPAKDICPLASSIYTLSGPFQCMTNNSGFQSFGVVYREPAKFVAKLREYKTDKNILCFKCEMGAGHFSQSGRFDRLKETALEFAFLLKSLLNRQPA